MGREECRRDDSSQLRSRSPDGRRHARERPTHGVVDVRPGRSPNPVAPPSGNNTPGHETRGYWDQTPRSHIRPFARSTMQRLDAPDAPEWPRTVLGRRGPVPAVVDSMHVAAARDELEWGTKREGSGWITRGAHKKAPQRRSRRRTSPIGAPEFERGLSFRSRLVTGCDTPVQQPKKYACSANVVRCDWGLEPKSFDRSQMLYQE